MISQDGGKEGNKFPQNEGGRSVGCKPKVKKFEGALKGTGLKTTDVSFLGRKAATKACPFLLEKSIHKWKAQEGE